MLSKLKSRKKRLNTDSENSLSPARPIHLDVIDRDRLRRVLASEPKRSPYVLEEGGNTDALTPASVLVPIVLREDGPWVLLTQRTDHLRDHPGQISFPGGRVEPDDQSPVHTALREANEEIGLASAHVEVVGFLPQYLTVTGYRITPVVALLTPPFELQSDPHEVAEIFEVPLAFLLNPANHQRHTAQYAGRQRHYFSMPYGKYFIWGATAGIIMTLYRALLTG